MDWNKRLSDLPASQHESIWIHDRLETLTAKESIILSAAVMRRSPESGADAINHLLSLADYEVCAPAGSYAQLGQFYLDYESSVPKRLRQYIDKEQLGIEDCRFEGYSFAWLRSSNDYAYAACQLNNCLKSRSINDYPVIAVSLCGHMLAAIEVYGNRIWQVRTKRNGDIRSNSQLSKAYQKWCCKNKLQEVTFLENP